MRVSLPAELGPNSEPEDRNRYAVGALMISPSPGGTEIRRDSSDSQQGPLVGVPGLPGPPTGLSIPPQSPERGEREILNHWRNGKRCARLCTPLSGFAAGCVRHVPSPGTQ